MSTHLERRTRAGGGPRARDAIELAEVRICGAKGGVTFDRVEGEFDEVQNELGYGGGDCRRRIWRGGSLVSSSNLKVTKRVSRT